MMHRDDPCTVFPFKIDSHGWTPDMNRLAGMDVLQPLWCDFLCFMPQLPHGCHTDLLGRHTEPRQVRNLLKANVV